SSTFLRSFVCSSPDIACVYSLSLRDALPISEPPPATEAEPPSDSGGVSIFAFADAYYSFNTSSPVPGPGDGARGVEGIVGVRERSEEHTSELQSRENLVCRLLLEKKK